MPNIIRTIASKLFNSPSKQKENEMTEPNQNQEIQAGAAAQEGAQEASKGQSQQASYYKELQSKKGFKTEDDLAKIYTDAEHSLSKRQSVIDKAKQQLESAGYTMNEDGTIIPLSQQQPHQQGYQQPYSQQGYQQQQGYQEPIYDPYTGQQITDPISLQLARMPVGHREAFVVNAMLEQRERQQAASFQAESEVLSRPEAKGFEADVKAVINQLPLAQRANKQTWEDALLRVKGMRYDTAMKSVKQEGVEEFINKEGLQVPQGRGGDEGNASLTPEQEQQYRYYQQNKPGFFKDKAHFLRATRPDGGR